MEKSKHRSVTISGIKGRAGSVSGLLVRPGDAKALLVLAHGAGAGMNHPFMNDLATNLADENVATLRFQFPSMEDGGKRPDNVKLATAAIAATVQWAQKEVPDLPLFAGGKSFGGRMTTTAAALGMIPGVRGIVCFGFPLHQAGKPSIERARLLTDVEVPMLWLQGTRDALAGLPLMIEVASGVPRAKMHVIEGADHGFAVLKSNGRNASDVIRELARETRTFLDTVRTSSNP